MAIFKNIIRGGQTNIHQFRMMRQILWVGFVISIVCSVFYGVDVSLKRIPSWAWHQWVDLKKAELWVAVLSSEQAAETFQDVRGPYGTIKNVSILSIIRDPSIKDTERRLYHELGSIGGLTLKFLLKMYLGIMLLWYLKGYVTRRSKHRRGSSLASISRLKWMIKFKRKASLFKIDGLPLIKDKETSHMLITGTTGSGKTNCLNKLLPQIRNQGQKAVIVDMNGTFVEKHYDSKRDIILNPFDQRSALWSPWADCFNQTHYDAFAAAMVPTVFKSDPFWDNASRIILSTALEKLREEGRDKVSALCRLLLLEKTRTVEKYFEGTRVSNLISSDSEKTTGSILANLGTHLKSLIYVEDTEKPFSIRAWVSGPQDINEQGILDQKNKGPQESGFLFITASPDQRESLRPLMTAWMDIVLNSLMSLSINESIDEAINGAINRKRRLWMIMDELPALHKLPSLPMV
jgi:hypothetical protein